MSADEWFYAAKSETHQRFPGSVVIHLQVARMLCESDISLRPALEGELFNIRVYKIVKVKLHFFD